MLPWTTKATNIIFLLWPLRCSFLCFNITTLPPLPCITHFAFHKDCLISVEDRRWWGKLAGKSVNSQRKDKESTGCSNGEWLQPQELDNFLILFTHLSPLRGCSKQRELKLKKHPERNNYTWTSEKTNVWSLRFRHIEQVLACWIGECQSSPQSMGKMLPRLGIYIPTHPVTS